MEPFKNWEIVEVTMDNNAWEGISREAIVVETPEMWFALKERFDKDHMRKAMHGEYDNKFGVKMNVYTMSKMLDQKTQGILKCLESGSTVIIWLNGSWCTLGPMVVLKRTILPFGVYPNESPAEIVVTENDNELEAPWVDYLQNNYGKNICGLVGFRYRELESVKQSFKDAKYITFSTTFTSWDWFEKLLLGMQGLEGKEIVGHVKSNEDWTEEIPEWLKTLWETVKHNNKITVVKI